MLNWRQETAQYSHQRKRERETETEGHQLYQCFYIHLILRHSPPPQQRWVKWCRLHCPLPFLSPFSFVLLGRERSVFCVLVSVSVWLSDLDRFTTWQPAVHRTHVARIIMWSELPVWRDSFCRWQKLAGRQIMKPIFAHPGLPTSLPSHQTL